MDTSALKSTAVGIGIVLAAVVVVILLLKLLGLVLGLVWMLLPVAIIAFLGYWLFKHLQKKGA